MCGTGPGGACGAGGAAAGPGAGAGLSLGGGMGTREDNLRVGSDATLEINAGVRKKIRAQVLLRRARVNEIGFEISDTDLESRYRLRQVLIEAFENAKEVKTADWDGNRK